MRVRKEGQSVSVQVSKRVIECGLAAADVEHILHNIRECWIKSSQRYVYMWMNE